MFKLTYNTPKIPDRVVVVGGSGFIGSHLISHLNKVGIYTQAISSKDVNLVEPASVLKLQGIIRHNDTLIILSSLTPDRGRDINTFMQNLKMGEHLASALESSPCRQILYMSSDAVYADSLHLIREESCCSPSSYHGLMHLIREKMISEATKQIKTPLTILRPTLMYGPGDTHNSYGPNRFLRMAREQGKINLSGAGEEQRDHIFIFDVCRLIELCLCNETTGTLNLATGKALTFFDVAQSVVKVHGTKVTIETTPRTVPITHRHFDITLLLKSFPSFQFTSLDQGLQETVNILEKSL